MILLTQFLKACISNDDTHHPNEKKIATNNTIAPTAENRILRRYNKNVENGLNEHRDPLLKELRLEMLTLMESLEKRIELKLIKMFESFKEEMV